MSVDIRDTISNLIPPPCRCVRCDAILPVEHTLDHLCDRCAIIAWLDAVTEMCKLVEEVLQNGKED